MLNEEFKLVSDELAGIIKSKITSIIKSNPKIVLDEKFNTKSDDKEILSILGNISSEVMFLVDDFNKTIIKRKKKYSGKYKFRLESSEIINDGAFFSIGCSIVLNNKNSVFSTVKRFMVNYEMIGVR